MNAIKKKPLLRYTYVREERTIKNIRKGSRKIMEINTSFISFHTFGMNLW